MMVKHNKLIRVNLDSGVFRFFGTNENGFFAYSILENGYPRENLCNSSAHSGGFQARRDSTKAKTFVRVNVWDQRATNRRVL